MDGEEASPMYVTLRDLAEAHLAIRGPGPRARIDFARSRASWTKTNGEIAQEFFGDELPVASILTSDGRLHLEYSAGEVSAIEPQFAETLTRIEFIASQADVFLEPARRSTPNTRSPSTTYSSFTRGRAVVRIQLFSTARYVLDFLEYALRRTRFIDGLRQQADEIRERFGLSEQEPKDMAAAARTSAKPISAAQDPEVAKAEANYAGLIKRTGALQGELRRLVDGASALVSARLADAEASVNRQARTTYTRRYLLGLGIGLLVMVGISIGAGLGVAQLHSNDVNAVSLGVALGAGAVGAGISVLARLVNANLRIDPGASPGEVRTAGISRAFIGSIFGGVVFAFGSSGLVSLPNGSGSAPSTLLWSAFGFLAGFSERWVQDLLGSVEGTAGVTPAKSGAKLKGDAPS